MLETAFPHRRAGYNLLIVSEWLEAKAKYDPTNLFRLNQNILPAG